MTSNKISELISQGYVLLVGIDYAHLIPRPNILPASTETITVPYDSVIPLMHSHFTAEINEEGYPPYKMGWREMGLEPPKTGESYYLVVQ